MLKHSVQIELFLILWVTKLIYSESPMYTVLDKDTMLMVFSSMPMPDSIVMSYVVSWVKKRSSQTSASINGEKMPMTSLLMMNYMLKGIPSNEPTLGWTVSGRY